MESKKLNENSIFCRTIKIQLCSDNSLLSGPYSKDFHIKDCIKVTIEQMGIIQIKLTSEKDILAKELFVEFQKIEKLIMLFNGIFMENLKIRFLDASGNSNNELINFAEKLKKRRLTYFKTADAYLGSNTTLMNYFDVINQPLFDKWCSLLDELDIIHTLLLYNTADTGMPVTIKCAFIIECYESLSELILVYNKNFKLTKDANIHKPTLKTRLDDVISKYGNEVFIDEYQKKDIFLKTLVNSRNNIMHIKRNQKKPYLNGPESVLYSMKLVFLYRKILLSLLGIDFKLYSEKLKESIKAWNNWQSVQERFLKRISCKGAVNEQQ